MFRLHSFPRPRYERRCLRVDGVKLWLDPCRGKELAFVSHAHSDHVARHQQTIASRATSLLMQARMGKKGAMRTLEYGQREILEDGVAISLHAAGHILGSSQILMETGDHRLLYTGDFKLRKGLAAEDFMPIQADVVIMETTFGLPRYVFPPTDQVYEAIVKFCRVSLAEGATPILLAYSLGKSQELLALLGQVGLPVMMHGAAEKISQVYREQGVSLPATLPFAPSQVEGHVIICPALSEEIMVKIPRFKVATVSGWALDPSTKYRMRCDAAFPLSDHAGFDDLLQFVEMSQPKIVYTLHGFAAPFAAELRARGIESWALTEHDQLEFSLG